MDLLTLAQLALLALADSTSFGTLIIPIWLLLAGSRPSIRRILIYLATVVGFYFLMGIVLALGARAFLESFTVWLQSGPGSFAMIVAGVALIGISFLFGKNKGDASGRLMRWRERAVQGGPIAPLMMLALTATLLEVAMMLPYLLAIGIMDAADLGVGTHLLVLLGYCLVMVTPALVLLFLRLVAGRLIEPFLQRVNNWFVEKGGEAAGWIVGIVGFLIARSGLQQIGGFAALGTMFGR